jgi:transcriptional regulator with XRE-family HTH domain
MKDPEKPRHAASQAVIELRQAMGMTQQQFAVQVLGTAVTTVARYETSHPPSGKMLVTLSDIAMEQSHKVRGTDAGRELNRLFGLFRALYLDDVRRTLSKPWDGTLYFSDPAEGDRQYGFLFAKLKGHMEVGMGLSFVDLLKAMRLGDPELSTTIRRELSKLALEYGESKHFLDHLKTANAKKREGADEK